MFHYIFREGFNCTNDASIIFHTQAISFKKARKEFESTVGIDLSMMVCSKQGKCSCCGEQLVTPQWRFFCMTNDKDVSEFGTIMVGGIFFMPAFYMNEKDLLNWLSTAKK